MKEYTYDLNYSISELIREFYISRFEELISNETRPLVLKYTQKTTSVEGFILIPPPIKERSLFILPEILCNALKRGEIWKDAVELEKRARKRVEEGRKVRGTGCSVRSFFHAG